jgi:hypothetical protein
MLVLNGNWEVERSGVEIKELLVEETRRNLFSRSDGPNEIIYSFKIYGCTFQNIFRIYKQDAAGLRNEQQIFIYNKGVRNLISS